MAASSNLSAQVLAKIQRAVDAYAKQQVSYLALARRIYGQLLDHEALAGKFHSIRFRVKDVDHLRKKLERKALEAKEKGRRFAIDDKNVLSKVEDLAGVRILHLHTNQIDEINRALKLVCQEISLKIIEGPIANTWDDEYREIFKKFKIGTRARDSMYTSVHYVVQGLDGRKCELQVRTLMEEVWGEVSHSIDYPEPTKSLPCREQIKVLARMTSGCTRLVDSIFLSHTEHQSRGRAASSVARRRQRHRRGRRKS